MLLLPSTRTHQVIQDVDKTEILLRRPFVTWDNKVENIKLYRHVTIKPLTYPIRVIFSTISRTNMKNIFLGYRIKYTCFILYSFSDHKWRHIPFGFFELVLEKWILYDCHLILVSLNSRDQRESLNG